MQVKHGDMRLLQQQAHLNPQGHGMKWHRREVLSWAMPSALGPLLLAT